jgi:hypothetical protein
MGYFLSKSSSYYEKSKIRFDRQLDSFDKRLSETITDHLNRDSDIRFSDGAYLGKVI